MDYAANRKDIEPGTVHRGGIDVGSMHLNAGHQFRQHGTYGSGATAQVNNNGRGGWRPLRFSKAEERCAFADQQFRPAAGHKDSRLNPDPQAAEFRPAENVLERKPLGPPPHGIGEFFGAKAGRKKEVRLVLGKDTAGGAEEAGDGGSGKR